VELLAEGVIVVLLESICVLAEVVIAESKGIRMCEWEATDLQYSNHKGRGVH